MNPALRRVMPLLAVAPLIVSVPVNAQNTTRILDISAGIADYDLWGNGTALVLGIQYSHSLHPNVLWNAGLTHINYAPRFGVGADSLADRVHYAVPEIGIQGTFIAGQFRPYVGAGVGYAIAVQGTGGGDPTLFGAAGIRANLTDSWGFRTEFRIRAIRGPLDGRTADWMVGISKWFGR